MSIFSLACHDVLRLGFSTRFGIGKAEEIIALAIVRRADEGGGKVELFLEAAAMILLLALLTALLRRVDAVGCILTESLVVIIVIVFNGQ